MNTDYFYEFIRAPPTDPVRLALYYFCISGLTYVEYIDGHPPCPVLRGTEAEFEAYRSSNTLPPFNILNITSYQHLGVPLHRVPHLYIEFLSKQDGITQGFKLCERPKENTSF